MKIQSSYLEFLTALVVKAEAKAKKIADREIDLGDEYYIDREESLLEDQLQDGDL